MHKSTIVLLLLLSLAANAQIRGRVTSANGEGIPFVSITLENTYTGTTANEEGRYELPVKSAGTYSIIFQSVGYKPKKITARAAALPHTLDIILEDESYQLGGLTIDSGAEDPAYAIIRQAIAHRKQNAEKAGRFEADFYSKGSYRVKNVPKKFMGMKVDTGEDLDSTGSGMIYLAETVSRITCEYPGKIKERVIASKVSGSDNGFSYNTARENNFDFYGDYVPFEIKMISPIAKGALGYYKYKLEGSFYDDDGHQINKIKVIPRRDKEPVLEGYIYIVQDSWALYAVDLDAKGYRMQMPVIRLLNVKQNFSYNSSNGIWAKNSQTLDFIAGMFGITFTGKFTHVYSNYEFREAFSEGTFGREIAVIEENFNKKDSVYWNTIRPVPLLEDEMADYKKKDSLQVAKKRGANSVITNHNRFSVFDIVGGYSYYKQDSLRSDSFRYDGLLDGLSYNTVQGWSIGTGLSVSLFNKKAKRYFSASARFSYGIAEDRLRVSGSFSRRIGKLGTFHFSGGSTIEQFNPNEPITPFINSISTLIFKDNYMKLYDNSFAKVSYGRSPFKWLMLNASVEYLRRRPLYNNADWVFIRDADDEYTSNNPLEPYNHTSAPFVKHNIMKAAVGGSIVFERDYITYPTGKMYEYGNRHPEITFLYEKTFAGSEKQYEYDFIAAKAKYRFSIDNKGDFGASLGAGKFFGADGIAFMDYKHFKGNQTHIGTDAAYLDVFNLLPYYSLSTNDAYVETHVEHNFKGYVMNKVPLLNVLQWNLILGYHSLVSPDYKPYHEVSVGFDNIGIGAFRVLRVDYVRAYQGGFATDGVVFGLHFFLD